MYDDIQRKRTNLHSGNQRPSSASAPRRPGKFGYMGFQIIVCAICIAAAVIIRFSGGAFYTLVRGSVSGALNSAVTGSDINQVFAAIKSGLPDMKDVFDSGSSKAGGNSSKSGSSSGTSAASGTSSNNSSASSKSSSASSKTSSSSSKTASGSSSVSSKSSTPKE